MKYLSDELYVNIPNHIATDYMNYTVTELNIRKDTRTEIFHGRVYKIFGGSKLYLNDILASRIPQYNPQWIPTGDAGFIPQPGMIVNIEVSFEDGTIETIDNLYYYYKDLGTPRGEDIDLISDAIDSKIYNLLNQRTKILPKLPVFNNIPKNFYFEALFAPNKKFRDISTKYDPEDSQYYPAVEICSFDGFHLSRIYGEANTGFLTDLVGNIYVGSKLLFLLNSNNIESIGITSTIAFDPMDPDPNLDNYVPLANIDKCPSKYYVIWYDRTGAYQCQPFSKRSIMTENIKTLTKTNLRNITTPYGKEISNTWKLNSDWLTQDEYKAFESIFTSPITYLYDYDNDELTQVNCLQSKWDEKTNKNSKKLYNLSIDLTIANPQNIIY